MPNLPAMNLEIMNVDKFITEHHCGEVVSPMIHEPSSSVYAHGGLFDEDIFGPVASPARFLNFGYITLNCRVFHPTIYSLLIGLKRFYGEIMSGKSYAIWDMELKDFVRASENDPDADTGYAFFLKHFYSIDFKTNKSLKRNNKIHILDKFKDRIFITKCLVIPAGIRDIREDETRMEKDSINSLYTSLLNSTRAMPVHGDQDPIYDVIHYSVQSKVTAVYDYLTGMVEGKGGFLQDKLAHRNIASGTRNVIAATDLEATDPDSPQYHKLGETKVPLFQAAKGFSSLVVYQIKSIFYQSVVNQDSDSVALINPVTLKLEYVPIDVKDKDFLVTEEGIQKTIERFQDIDFRFRPVTARSNGKQYYLYLVYDDGQNVYTFRNLGEIMAALGDKFDKKYIRPLTYTEMLYVATYFASAGKSGTTTRYPITDDSSIFVGKVHLMSTSPARIVNWVTNAATGEGVQLPEYPTIGSQFIDAVMIHPTYLAGLGADFDGNCVTGDTRIQIRYAGNWLEIIKSLDYSISKQNIDEAVENILKDAVVKDECTYTTIDIQDIPQPGEFVYDRNNAKVYTLPAGCEVLSWENGIEKWMPFEKVTVEEDCEYVTIAARNRTVNVSTNPSVAVFDHWAGGLKKVTPKEAAGLFAPVIKKDPLPFGTEGTFDDGWLLGVMVSDGYVTEKYLGYTKLEDALRNKVIDLVKKATGQDIIFKEYMESPEDQKKLGNSASIHFTDSRAIDFGHSLEMYTGDLRDALSKYIPEKKLLNGSKEYLLGILCGLLDGDGSILVDKSDSICFRFSTSSDALIKSIQLLGYRLGINVGKSTVPPRSWSKKSYVALFRTNDIFQYINELSFVSERNIALLEKFKKDSDKYAYGSTDRIPLTRKEANDLYRIKKELGYEDQTLRYSDVAMRYKLAPLAKYLDPTSSLYARITNTKVEWNRVNVISVPERATVYDLLVPESKVFAVNNGLVIYDTVTWIPLFSDEANQECEEYENSLRGYLQPDGKPRSGTDDLTKICLRALTADCAELHT